MQDSFKFCFSEQEHFKFSCQLPSKILSLSSVVIVIKNSLSATQRFMGAS